MMVINWLRNQGMFVVSGSAWPRYHGILKTLPTRVKAELSSQAGPGIPTFIAASSRRPA